jgi:diamine N-acetyltransferase
MVNLDLFKSENIYLRTLEPQDIEVLFYWENDTRLWHLSNTQKPFSKHVLQAFIDEAHLDIYTTKYLRLLICLNHNHEAIGAIDLFDYDPFHLRAGVGILIHDEQHRNKGYASEALQLLVNYASSVLQLNQLYCNINANNFESIQLFTKQGFEKCGIKKSWNKTAEGFVDECMFQLIIK